MARLGQSYSPIVRDARYPAALEQPLCHGGAERPGQVIAPLAPIQACSCLGTPAVQDLVSVEPLALKPGDALVADAIGVRGVQEHAALEHPFGQGNAYHPSQVIVACPGKANGACLVELAERVYRCCRRKRRKGLQHLCHMRPGQPVIAVPPIRRDAEQSTRNELGEVCAPRLGRDTRTAQARTPLVAFCRAMPRAWRPARALR